MHAASLPGQYHSGAMSVPTTWPSSAARHACSQQKHLPHVFCQGPELVLTKPGFEHGPRCFRINVLAYRRRMAFDRRSYCRTSLLHLATPQCNPPLGLRLHLRHDIIVACVQTSEESKHQGGQTAAKPTETDRIGMQLFFVLAHRPTHLVLRSPNSRSRCLGSHRPRRRCLPPRCR